MLVSKRAYSMFTHVEISMRLGFCRYAGGSTRTAPNRMSQLVHFLVPLLADLARSKYHAVGRFHPFRLFVGSWFVSHFQFGAAFAL